MTMVILNIIITQPTGSFFSYKKSLEAHWLASASQLVVNFKEVNQQADMKLVTVVTCCLPDATCG